MASPPEYGGDIFIPAPHFTFTAGIDFVGLKMCVMYNDKGKLSIEGIKEIDMVTYLSSLGHEPVSIRGAAYWYLSPLREERTASFKVDRKLNRWYDHGTGEGGNIIDFGIRYHSCPVGDFLQAISGNDLLPAANNFKQEYHGKEVASRIIVNDVFPIRSKALINYLGSRKIALEIATLFCSEARFSLYGKNYFAIGVENDFGGFELRNKFFKGSSSPKGYTTIKNGHVRLAVFEGFFDMLSYKVLEVSCKVPAADYMVLNSLAFFEAARPVMESYDKATLYLDNDRSGQNCMASALTYGKAYEDGSLLYKGFDDLNHALVKSFDGGLGQARKPLPDEIPRPRKKNFNRRI